MLQRIIQKISQLISVREPSAIGVHAGERVQCRASRHSREGGEAIETALASPRLEPRFTAQHLENRGHRHVQTPGLSIGHQTAARLLRDGRLLIGITGFHDTAFTVSILTRHDSSDLAAAIVDLPCRTKMVPHRNILEGVERALTILSDTGPGRRGLILITSGDSPEKQALLDQTTAAAAAKRICIHVICLGVKPGDPTGGPRVNTKDELGYGGCHWVTTEAQLAIALRYSLEGLTPAFGMIGTNKAVFVLDCSEVMVEAYRGTTRIEMVVTAIRDLVQAPLAERYSAERPLKTGIQRSSPSPVTACQPESRGSRNGLQGTANPERAFAYAAPLYRR